MKITYHQYAEDVRSGKIVTCKWTKLAVERYFNDLERAGTPDFPYYFDEEEARYKIEFYSFLHHTKGELTGQPLKLEGWQQFGIANIYGWKELHTGFRRFTNSYWSMARGNGKSTLGSGVASDALTNDDEGGPRVVTIATKKKQARIVYDDAVLMMEKSGFFEEFGMKKYKDHLQILGTAGRFDYLGRDSKTEDGVGYSCCICDEYHAHPSAMLKNVVSTGQNRRRQPLMFIITTAGFDENCACKEEEDYVKRILQGVEKNESYFGIIYTLDEDDDWRDERNWEKANPNLGVSVYLENLRKDYLQADAKASSRIEFQTKNLNLWTNSITAWLDFEIWKKNCNSQSLDRESLRGRESWTAIDLAETNDITHVTHCFYPQNPGELFDFFHRAYIPEEGVDEKGKKDKCDYRELAKLGFITLTVGNVTNIDQVVEDIIEDSELWYINEISLDPHKARFISNKLLDAGFNVLEFTQSGQNVSPAARLFERSVIEGRMNHGNNSLMDYYVHCCGVKYYPNETIRPVKVKEKDPHKHIDGIVTSYMALSRADCPENSTEYQSGVLML